MHAGGTGLAWLCERQPGSTAPGLAVVVAHPDDEVIGAGARLRERAPCLLVQVTDGAPRDGADARRAGCSTLAAYARLRAAERDEAAGLLGIPRRRIVELAAPDQEAALELAPLARRCAALFRAHHVELVLTQPYEGGHPDHDSTAFAVHAACALLRHAGESAPAILEMTAYHRRDHELTTGGFLPGSGRAERAVPLSDADRAHKRRLYDCYRTQAPVLAHFPIGAVERFRVAPRYDFRRPPHAGAPYYELHPWGMHGERWRALAAAAVAELGIALGGRRAA